MDKTISLGEIIDRELDAVLKYRLWYNAQDDPCMAPVLNKVDEKTKEAETEIESARKELADYIRNLMAEY